MYWMLKMQQHIKWRMVFFDITLGYTMNTKKKIFFSNKNIKIFTQVYVFLGCVGNWYVDGAWTNIKKVSISRVARRVQRKKGDKSASYDSRKKNATKLWNFGNVMPHSVYRIYKIFAYKKEHWKNISFFSPVI